jgi:competence ComEA-like helix-hairpin-helix protein
MANGIVERGEIYWVRMSNTVGSEESVGRPGVIISSKKGNETAPIVQIAYTTTQVKYGIINPSTYASGKKTWILCNQIYTVDKTRLERFVGKLTDEEMREVDTALEAVFDLGYKDDGEVERLKAQIAELTGEVAREQAKYIELSVKHEDELLSYKVENTMWQKCYEKVLTQLVDMKCTNDLFVRGHLGRNGEEPKVPIKVEIPKQPEEPVKVVDPEEPVLNVPAEPVKVVVTETRVDVNHCTQTQLKKVGMSDGLARAVVAKRPFNSVADLKNVPGMNGKKFQIFEPKLTCTPLEIVVLPEEPVVQPEAEESDVVAEVTEVTEAEPVEIEGKLNINTALAKELNEKTGLNLGTSYSVVGYRRKNGPYEKLEDLLKVNNVFPGTLEKLRDKIWCGPGVEETPTKKRACTRNLSVEPYTGEKVNINELSAEEIHEKTGLNISVCYYMTGYRRKNGPYKSVKELLNVSRFSEYHLQKYGPMFEV